MFSLVNVWEVNIMGDACKLDGRCESRGVAWRGWQWPSVCASSRKGGSDKPRQTLPTDAREPQ